jgi:2'-5' RNA ligase
MVELVGAIAARLRSIQEHYDPRMAAELPPHITLGGSSGMGPIPATTPVAMLHDVLAPIAATTSPLVVRFDRPMRFMQSNVVVLPIDPNGPIRALHERIKTSGLSFERARFTFTPHCTLSFYRELPRKQLAELLRVRIDEPIWIDAIQAYRALNVMRPEKVLDLKLGGVVDPGIGMGERT